MTQIPESDDDRIEVERMNRLCKTN